MKTEKEVRNRLRKTENTRLETEKRLGEHATYRGIDITASEPLPTLNTMIRILKWVLGKPAAKRGAK